MAGTTSEVFFENDCGVGVIMSVLKSKINFLLHLLIEVLLIKLHLLLMCKVL